MTRTYVKCQIAGKGREYTYHCDDNVQPGDTVEFTLPSGVNMTAEVRETSLNIPPFPTKPALKVMYDAPPPSTTDNDEEIPF